MLSPYADGETIWSAFEQLPLTCKNDIVPDSADGPSKLFCGPTSSYVRYHQTSGSRGYPMPVLDTAEDWRWWIECWQHVLDAAEVTPQDVALMAFSFGPFIGFWSANDALVHRGSLVIPGGGLSSEARLQMLMRHQVTVVCCTPTYAMHLASVAERMNVDLSRSAVRCLIVAGEPGGSIPAVRETLSQQWNARIVDHAGASEIGAWGFSTDADDGLHVLESEFIAEFALHDDNGHVAGFWTPDQATGESKSPPLCELVLSNLGRRGGPLLRYRTGDMVRPIWDHGHDCAFVKLAGGVLGRADDMMVIRGVNVFPSSIEAVVREHVPTAEFRMIAQRHGHLDSLRLKVEATAEQCDAMATDLRDRLAMRVTVVPVESGSLPRFEAKAKRWIDERSPSENGPTE